MYPKGNTVLIKFSKSKYGSVEIPMRPEFRHVFNPAPVAEGSQSAAAAAHLTWRLNTHGYPEWWDGANWKLGQYSEEHKRYYAVWGGQYFWYQ
jgi:hypothetical protein